MPAQPKRRARSSLAKKARAGLILASAEKLFLQNTSLLPTVQQIAKEAKIAKGTVYLYFPTKEEIFLNVLQHHLGQWENSVSKQLSNVSGELTPDTIINAYLDYPTRFPIAMTLATLSPLALEANITEATLIDFKSAQIARIGRLASAVSDRIDGWSAAEPSALFLRSYACLLGIWQLADPPEACKRVLERPELAPLKVCFETEARRVLTPIWIHAWPDVI